MIGKQNATFSSRADFGGRFWYVIFQISHDLIPAAYENEKKLVDFPRLNPSLT